ncbi:MAG: hypothetical protein LR006_01260, partial [Dehalococcoidia bacterium]|nr:hypothetical protein [Dehalococcoidia bacterium]
MIVTVSCVPRVRVTPEEFIVTTNPAWQRHPSISGTIVVWQDRAAALNDNIYAYDLENGTEFVISTDPGLAGDPDISGGIVVWADNR